MAGIRRTWDKSYYEAKAKERLELGDDDSESLAAKSKKNINTAKEEFMAADKDAQVITAIFVY